MRIEILDSAEKDLLDGFELYERQSKGLGNYFSTLFFQIESRSISMPVFTASILYIIACYPKDSPSPSTVVYKKTSSGSMPFWIAAGILLGLEIDFRNLRTSGWI